MDLRHFRYFLAVAEEGHITRAAERLGIQQPPLSQQIKAMETELNVQLFRRLPRGVELTEAGRALLPEARAIISGVEEAIAKTKRTARGEEGALSVGFTSSSPFHPFVPQIIRRYRERFPKVELILEEAGTAEMAEALKAERLDIAFVRSPIADRTGLVLHLLVQEPMLLAIPQDHRLAGQRTPVGLHELADEPLILYRRAAGQGLYDAIMEACSSAGFEPVIAQQAPRIVSTLNLVAAGLGVTIAPASLRQLGMDGVVFCELAPDISLKAPIWIAVRTTDHSVAAQEFVALARKLTTC
ncbi:LysR family transcriptional regulator [Alphaproteobacteria bacterium HT1-32]|nr:LysR family transcriptional regulator [Alphaproteobacteria bacterium HT1-32]